MVRTQALVGLALVMLLSLVPTGLGWSVPEGEPYEADKRVVLDEPANREDLVQNDGILAWTQYSYNATTGETNWDDGPRIGFLNLSAAAQTENATFPTDQPADGPTVAKGYVAWRAHPNGYDREGDGAQIRVLDLETDRVRTVEPVQGRTAPPALDGEDLYWLTYDLGDEQRTIHRLNLSTGERSSWASPTDWDAREIGIAGESLLISAGRLVAWVPGSNVTRLVAKDVIMYDADGHHVVTVEFRQDDGGRGASLYLQDIANGTERRLTFSDGRETDPTLSGSLVAWADVRRGQRSDPNGPHYDVYFQDITTRNEYKIEGTRGITAMPELVGDRVYYGDDRGRLMEAELPSRSERLVSDPVSTLENTANGTQRLNVTLNGSGEHTVAWDADADGTFETEGNLTVEISNRNETPNETVQGVAVEADGRYVVVTVDTGAAYRMASATTDGSAQGNQTGASKGENLTGSESRDADSQGPTGQHGAEDQASRGSDGPSPPGDPVDTAPRDTKESRMADNTTDRQPGGIGDGSNATGSGNPTPGPGMGVLLAVVAAAVVGLHRRG